MTDAAAPEAVALLLLVRDPVGPDPEAPTMGTMTADGLPVVLQTLEPPWKGNRHEESCVPEGDYGLLFHRSPRFHGSLMPELQDVPDRQEILVHPGNVLADTHGCILPGMARSEDGRSVRRSAIAVGFVVDWLRRALAGGRAVCRISRAPSPLGDQPGGTA